MLCLQVSAHSAAARYEDNQHAAGVATGHVLISESWTVALSRDTLSALVTKKTSTKTCHNPGTAGFKIKKKSSCNFHFVVINIPILRGTTAGRIQGPAWKRGVVAAASNQKMSTEQFSQHPQSPPAA